MFYSIIRRKDINHGFSSNSARSVVRGEKESCHTPGLETGPSAKCNHEPNSGIKENEFFYLFQSLDDSHTGAPP
ncbi:Hypothetical predicted protein [Octopus vulgaris]|uniref:Uncharacterized protein n=1 Tax=Octopus vulgaris TaxID=6645 RepID=A0AA36F4P5_OCTVU|nr:Hypothetical predicted protein [Octopus vulgaris]